MAEATTLETLSPKELGKHLRDVRRRKGLSLSEVARGAGLTRRELNAYEKGRIAIPDSDLFVLAGSCGVDVAELRVPMTTAELAAAQPVDNALVPAVGPQPLPSTIEDTVAQLRRSQEVAAPSVPEVSGRRRPRALGAADELAEPAQTEWPVERIDPFEAVDWPGDASIASPSTSMPLAPAEPIDVFEELARLPEPGPLPANDRDAEDMFGPLSDLSAPLAEVVDGVDAQAFDEWPAFESDYEQSVLHESDGEPVLVEMPQNAVSDLRGAADAPPIDVAMRGETLTSPWDSLRGSEALSTPVESESVFDWSDESPTEVTTEPVPDSGWEPAPATSDWDTPWLDDAGAVATPDTDPTAFDVHVDDDWTAEAVEAVGEVEALDEVDAFHEVEALEEVEAFEEVEAVDTATETSVSHIFDPRFAGAPAESAPGSWAHAPDPEATSTGFYIDWGEPEGAEPASIGSGTSAWDLPPTVAETAPETLREFEFEAQPETAPEPIVAPWGLANELQTFATECDEAGAVAEAEAVDVFEPIDGEPIEAWEPGEPELVKNEPIEAWQLLQTEPVPAAADELPIISWRPPSDDVSAQPIEAFALTGAVLVDEPPAPEPEPEPEPEELFVVAGTEWVLGNAVPLVEVRSTGSLVMRRADERWALADVTAALDFALEVSVDLRSGPGFGVLFRAEVDGEGRMSGYSFDVDPVYEGGGYLVREWRADRELWNPIAHVSAPDTGAMHGVMAVRLTVDNDSLVASVNGESVLTVDSLKQASVERGREGVAGNRVGIQAWSSTDLVIDELRVAEH